MGEMTFKDAAERYGPAVALILALVLLVTLLPGNAKTKNAENVKSGGSSGASAGDNSAGTATTVPSDVSGQTQAGASQSGGTAGGAAAAAGTQGGTAKAAGGPVQVPQVVQAQQGSYACRSDGRQAGVSVAMPPCKQYDATKGNGGATAPGVTATTIKIAYYIPKPNPATEAALKGAGVADDQKDVDRIMEVYRKYWNWHAQTYGREVVFDNIYGQADIADDVGMRAEANKIADAHYFGVIVARGTTGSPMFERTIGQRKVLCFACTTSQSTSFYEATAGYNFGSLQTVREYYENVAEYIAKRLVGNNRTAEWAGTNVPVDYKTKPRKFGLIWLHSVQGTVDPGAQEERDYFFNTILPKFNLPRDIFVDSDYNFDYATGPTTAQQVISKMHSENATTLVCICDALMPVHFTNEATNEGYFPEWLHTGTGLTDTTFFGRTYNQQQWGHSFGMSSLWVFWTHLNVSEGYREYHDTCPFVFPNDASQCADKKEGVGVNTYRAGYIYLYAGISGAGPNLTPQTLAQGIYDYPPTGGTPSIPLIHFTKESPVAIKDETEVFWDPNAEGPDEVGTNGHGFLLKVNGGKRYQIGGWPTTDPQVLGKAVGAVGTSDDPYVHGQHFDDPPPRSPKEKCLSCPDT